MGLYLCVDCGGSKTSAVISDANGNIVGRALGGPSNYSYLSLEDFVSTVKGAVNDALKACISVTSTEPGLSPPPSTSPFVAAWFGVSGLDSPASVLEVTPVLSGLVGVPVGPDLMVTNDTHLLAAPVRMYTDISTAVVVIGGTGSIVVSFKEEDGNLQELGRVGGWGWILGDEGGGYSVGREAVRQILMQHDKATVQSNPPPQSKLTARFLELFGVSDVLGLLMVVHFSDPSPSAITAPDTNPQYSMVREKRLSSLAPLVFAAAFEDGDPLALNVLRTCAGVLASQIAVLLGESTDAFPKLVKAQDSIVSFGGSLMGVEAYRNMILEDLARRGHVFRYMEFVADAGAVGATGLALSHTQA